MSFYPKNKKTKIQRGVQEGNHYMEDGRVVNVPDLLHSATTPFGEVMTVEKTPIINLQAHHGITQQRDYILEDGAYTTGSFSGTNRVANDGKWHTVSVNDANQSTYFETGQQGVYISGYWAEVGKGIQIPNITKATELPQGIKVYWGYMDDTDGFGMMAHQSGLYIFIRHEGEDTLIGRLPDQDLDTTQEKEGWNIDTLSGERGDANQSGFELDLSRGYMFQERFLHYGFGAISFYLNVLSDKGFEKKLELHKFEKEGAPVLDNPNLPISVHIETDGTYSDGQFDVNVGGRQMSILGNYTPMFRYSHANRTITLDTNDWTPIISGRTFQNGRKGIQSFINRVTISANYNIEWSVFLNAEIDTDNYQAPINTALETRDQSETSVVFDDTGSSFTSGGVSMLGDIVFGGTDSGGTGATKSNFEGQSETGLVLPIPRDRIVTLGAKRLTTNSTDVTGLLGLRQEF